MLLVFFLFLPSVCSTVADSAWELIGSRTYEWKGDELLRCKHWDKVAIRWHLYSCEAHNATACDGGSNVDLVSDPETDDIPRWRNAFTYVQFEPTDKHKLLRLGLDGYDDVPVEVESIVPLKIDVDWRWSVRDGCNTFMIRMSAMSTLDAAALPRLSQFCRLFDRDGFLHCDNL